RRRAGGLVASGGRGAQRGGARVLRRARRRVDAGPAWRAGRRGAGRHPRRSGPVAGGGGGGAAARNAGRGRGWPGGGRPGGGAVARGRGGGTAGARGEAGLGAGGSLGVALLDGAARWSELGGDAAAAAEQRFVAARLDPDAAPIPLGRLRDAARLDPAAAEEA